MLATSQHGPTCKNCIASYFIDINTISAIMEVIIPSPMRPALCPMLFALFALPSAPCAMRSAPCAKETQPGHHGVNRPPLPGFHIYVFRSALPVRSFYPADLAQDFVIMNRLIQGDQGVSLGPESNLVISRLSFLDNAMKQRSTVAVFEEYQVPFSQGIKRLPSYGCNLVASKKRHHAPPGHSHPQAQSTFQDIFKKCYFTIIFQQNGNLIGSTPKKQTKTFRQD